jgi:hypothetical protein
MYVTGTGVWATREVTRADRDEPTRWFVASSGIEECVINEIVSPPGGASLLSVMWDIDGFRHEDVDVSPPQGFFNPAFGHNRAIDFSESDPNFVVRVYEGGQTHGAYSIDNGRTWAEFPAAPPGRGGGHVAVSADGKAVVWSPQDASPQVSHDCGKSWDACEGIGRTVRVVSDRVNASTFYALDDGKFFASTDGGKSFTARTAGDLPKGEAFIRAVPGQAGHVWLASSEGLFVSLDAGSSFKQLAGLDSVRRMGFGKAASGQDYPVIYLTGKSAGVYGFYRSTDRGVSWARINDDLHQFGTINTITGDPRVFGRVYVGSANRGIIYGEPAER